jgi:predicted enzyme related to lactoylglutathione lyase
MMGIMVFASFYAGYPGKEPDLDATLNFLGIHVVDWNAAYLFYTEVLGLRSLLQPKYGDWAELGGGWKAYHAGSRSMVLELFDGGRPVSGARSWGRAQAVRPAIQVDDLDTAIADLRSRGVPFTGGILEDRLGKRVEFVSPEEIRWSLAQIPGRPSSTDRSRPYIGHVEIKANDLAGQTAFYHQVMGMSLESDDLSPLVLGQGSGKPWLTLEPGGESRIGEPPSPQRSPTCAQPVFISFMTTNVEDAREHLRDANVTFLQNSVLHSDWGGTDVVVADADGNAVQIVQYPR